MGTNRSNANDAARKAARTSTESGPSHVHGNADHRYRRMFETSQDGILLLHAGSGRIIDANPFMTRLLGLSHAEFLGKQLWEVGLLRNTDRRVVEHDVSDIGAARCEELLVRSAAHPHGMDVEMVSSTYREGDHDVTQCHVRDITGRKRAEAEGHADEHEVPDRHTDEFLAMLSHELRNAIAPVANALLILRLDQGVNSQLPNRARSMIERQVGHLTHLVDDLQEVSRLGTGRLRLQTSVVDLRAVVQRSVEAVMSAHAHRGHRVSVTAPEEPVWLDADPIRLEQVAVNLITNAAKYTPDGGGITVTIVRAQHRAELHVADTGMGISQEMLPRVFDLFTRADDAGVRARNGLGIGLNVVKQIVDLHGGSVVALSDGPGAGSEFIVSLPSATHTT